MQELVHPECGDHGEERPQTNCKICKEPSYALALFAEAMLMPYRAAKLVGRRHGSAKYGGALSSTAVTTLPTTASFDTKRQGAFRSSCQI